MTYILAMLIGAALLGGGFFAGARWGKQPVADEAVFKPKKRLRWNPNNPLEPVEPLAPVTPEDVRHHRAMTGKR